MRKIRLRKVRYLSSLSPIGPQSAGWPNSVSSQNHCLSHRTRRWHPTPVLLPGKSHGWRSLVGYRPWGREESDTTERLHFHFSLSCIGERNGNPLQCSCLENPRNRGAWWAAVLGSHRLTRRSSSSSSISTREGSHSDEDTAQPQVNK